MPVSYSSIIRFLFPEYMMVSYGNTITYREHNWVFPLHEEPTYRIINTMKFFVLHKKPQETIVDYKLEVVLQKGKEQLRKMVQLGIFLPVVAR